MGYVIRKKIKKKKEKKGNSIYGKSNGKLVLIATQTHKSIFD